MTMRQHFQQETEWDVLLKERGILPDTNDHQEPEEPEPEPEKEYSLDEIDLLLETDDDTSRVLEYLLMLNI